MGRGRSDRARDWRSRGAGRRGIGVSHLWLLATAGSAVPEGFRCSAGRGRRARRVGGIEHSLVSLARGAARPRRRDGAALRGHDEVGFDRTIQLRRSPLGDYGGPRGSRYAARCYQYS